MEDPFNRYRERDLGTEMKQFHLLGIGTAYRECTNKTYILDSTPVGKFHPGDLKLRPVQLGEVRMSMSNADLKWYTKDTDVVPSHTGSGSFVSGYQVAFDANYLPLPSDDPVRFARLMRKSFLKISEDSLGVAETLAEYKQCLSLVKDPVRGMVDIFKRHKRQYYIYRRSQGNKPSMKSLAEFWLQYRYGFAPLAQTVIATLTKLPDYQEGIRTFAAREQEETSVDPTNDLRSILGSRLQAVRSGGSQNSVTSYVARHYVKIRNAADFNAYKRGGTLNSLPSLMYNLTSYSFVVDWFFDLGGFIQGLTPPMGAYIWPYATYSVQRNEDTANWASSTGYLTKTYPLRPSTRLQATCNRRTYRRLVVDSYSTSLPSLQQGINSVVREIDAISLLFLRAKQILRGH